MKKLVLVLAVLNISLVSTNAFALIGIDNYTVLMLHGNGTDSSTNFVDSSFSNHPVTAYGDAQIDTAQKKFGTGSAFFDGDGDYLFIPDSDDWCFGTGDFTMDFWMRFNVLSDDTTYTIAHQAGYGGKSAWQVNALQWFGGTMLRFILDTDGIGPWEVAITEYTPLAADTWYHIAAVRNGDRIDLYKNGVSVGNASSAGVTAFNSSAPLQIASLADWETDFNGWLDELRISKGIARWTSDFTPPTSEYEVIPEPTSLLLLGLGLLGALFKRKT